jgi:hypothetical protein
MRWPDEDCPNITALNNQVKVDADRRTTRRIMSEPLLDAEERVPIPDDVLVRPDSIPADEGPFDHRQADSLDPHLPVQQHRYQHLEGVATVRIPQPGHDARHDLLVPLLAKKGKDLSVARLDGLDNHVKPIRFEPI